MSEKEYSLALKLLHKENISAIPNSLRVIGYMDKQPYAYSVGYTDGNTSKTVVCLLNA